MSKGGKCLSLACKGAVIAAVSFLVLEIFLRVLAFTYIAVFTRKADALRSGTTIICEGDSFTFGVGGKPYPDQLEEVLNRRAGKREYNVVNLGVPTKTIVQIADELPSVLDKYRPAALVLLSGRRNTILDMLRAPDAAANPELKVPFMRHFASYRLFEMILFRRHHHELAVTDDFRDAPRPSLPPDAEMERMISELKTLAAAGRNREAREVAGRLSGVEPLTYGAMVALGDYHAGALSCRDADRWYRKALEKGGDTQSAYLGLARMYAGTCNVPDKAVSWAGIGLKKYPASDALFFAGVEAMVMAGQYDAAFSGIMALPQKQDKAREALFTFFRALANAGRDRLYADYAMKAIEGGVWPPNIPHLATIYVNGRMDPGINAQGAEFCRRGLDKWPDVEPLYSCLARTYNTPVNRDSALAYALKAEKKFPGSEETLLALSDIYKDSGRFADALSALSRVKTPTSETELKKGEILMMSENYGRAVEKLKTLTGDAKVRARAYSLLGTAYYRQGIFQKSLDAYIKAFEYECDAGKAYQAFKIAMLYAEKKDAAGTSEYCRKALSYDPVSSHDFVLCDKKLSEIGDSSHRAEWASIPNIQANPNWRAFASGSAAANAGNIVASSLERILKLCAERHIPVILSGYPDTNIAEVTAAAAKWKVAYIDMKQVFSARFTSRDEYVSFDGEHCNTSGYHVMAEAMADEIMKLASGWTQRAGPTRQS